MKTHLLCAVFACLFSLAFSKLVFASLFDHGDGLIYDDDLYMTWLQDANFAMTSGFDTDGLMTWVEADGWAASLGHFDSVRNVTYNDWRLPTTLQPDSSSFNDVRFGAVGPGWTGSDWAICPM